MDTKSEVKWTVTAGELANADALFRLADWHEKGVKVAQDLAKAAQYRLKGYRCRALLALKERRYDAALPDLQKALDIKGANAEDHNELGECYGKLGRWDEAIKAYTRSIELDLKSDAATGHILNLLEALVAADRSEQLLQFIQTVERKGWKLPKEGTPAAEYNALYHGFRAIALRMSGKDALDAERQMRQYTGKPGYKLTGWTWDELDQWLRRTKLAPDRKAAVGKLIAELKGPVTR
jgi:tetratricopeptide (TPR) repeat protein